MLKSLWDLVLWASKLVQVGNSLAVLTGISVVAMIAAAASFFGEHYLLGTVLATAVVMALLVIVPGYCWTAPKGSYFPRYYSFYKNPLSRVSWRLGGVQIFDVRDGRVVVGEFHCSFMVNRRRLKPKKMELMFDGKTRPVPVSIQVTNEYHQCEDIEYIPSGVWMICKARLLKDETKPDDGVVNHPTVPEFYSKFGPFELVFEAEGYRFSTKYNKYELDMMIRGQENVLHPPALVTPKLKAQASGAQGRSKADGVGLIAVNGRWILHFNPNHLKGKKEISFKSDGTIEKGRNRNEHTWFVEGDVLEIVRENGDLQNRFRYNAETNTFICTGEPHAKGIKKQVIRPA